MYTIVCMHIYLCMHLAFNSEDSMHLTASNCSTFRSTSEFEAEVTHFLHRLQPMIESNKGIKAVLFTQCSTPLLAISTSELLIMEANNLPYLPSGLKFYLPILFPPIFCLMGFRCAVHSEVFPWAIWLPFSLSVSSLHYNNLLNSSIYLRDGYQRY